MRRRFARDRPKANSRQFLLARLGTVQLLSSISTMGGGGPFLAIPCAYVVVEGGVLQRKGLRVGGGSQIAGIFTT